MKSLRYILPFSFLVLALSTACQGNGQAADGQADSLAAAKDTVFLPKDDADLHLALTQTLESLPYYYADAHGLFARHGLKVRVHSYAAQFDADTALLGTTAQVGVTDLVRLNLYEQQHRKPLQPVHATNGNWMLIVNNKERIKQVDKLAERQLATARFSASDYYSSLALQDAKLGYDDCFRPQVNDYHVRLQMLLQHQVDAAVLPEPFAARAIQAGHTRLYATQDKQIALLGCVATRQDWAKLSASQTHLSHLKAAYNEAVQTINKQGLPAVRDILVKEYRMDTLSLQRLRLPKYEAAREPETAAQQAAQQFFSARKRPRH